MENRVKKLLTEVSDSERATLPRHKYVKNPEVAPPGLAAKIIRPTFISADKGANIPMIKAMTGSPSICAPKAEKKARG
jgi:hypothetical protein